MPSWFDIRHLDKLDNSENDDEQGMLETLKSVDELIQAEVDSGIPENRIVLGGFSQGGAISVLNMLTTKRKLAGVVALSTWVPLNHKIVQVRIIFLKIMIWKIDLEADDVWACQGYSSVLGPRNEWPSGRLPLYVQIRSFFCLTDLWSSWTTISWFSCTKMWLQAAFSGHNLCSSWYPFWILPRNAPFFLSSGDWRSQVVVNGGAQVKIGLISQNRYRSEHSQTWECTTVSRIRFGNAQQLFIEYAVIWPKKNVRVSFSNL